MEGWIKLSRCLMDKPIFQNEKLLKVWVWCLLKATHKGYEQLVGLQKVWLEPGQFIFGRKKAAEELSITESTVWRLMQFLADKNNPSLEVVTYNKYSVITIVNWAGYQVEKTDRCEPSNNKGSTTFQEQQMNNRWTANEQQMDTNKNDKNVKKYIYSSLHSQLAELLVDRITANKPNFKIPANIDSWSNEVRLMMENDKRTYEQIESVINWCQQDSFWQSNILSIKKLREKFDQLESKMKQKTVMPQQQLSVREQDKLRRRRLAEEYDRIKRGDGGSMFRPVCGELS
jgi:hypothetical protein